MNITDIQNDIIEEFAMFDEWMEKYEYLIELSKELPAIAIDKKDKQYLINGCQSKVWLAADLNEDNTIHFTADSDAIITKGIVALLIRVFDNQTPETIINTDLFFIDKIGLKENLSPTRSNGLVSMLKQIKMYAVAYKAKLNS